MINELEHIKLSFSQLPAADHSDNWMKYKLDSAGDAWIIFALETRDGGDPQWRRIHASYGLSGRDLYGDYKRGAAWEIHSQQRLLRGRKVKVENYLAELKKLPLSQLSELHGLLPVAHKFLNEHGLEDAEVYSGYRWDKSSWTKIAGDDSTAYEVPLDSRQNLVYVSCVTGPSSVFLTKKSVCASFTPSTNLELFA
jgi:hypothetical protein